jgi:hypothetical protein
MNQLKDCTFEYRHYNSLDTTNDLIASSNDFTNVPDNFIPYYKNQDTTYINAWIGHSNKRFIPSEFITLDTNYEMFKSTLNDLFPRINLPPSDNFVPTHISRDVPEVKTPAVFMATGAVHSGQCIGYNYNTIVKSLSEDHPNVYFYITTNISDLPQNVIYTGGFFGNKNCDLPENGVLSTKCKIIVGSGSGPFCFTCTRQNFFDKNKTMICIAHRPEFWFHNGTCKYIHNSANSNEEAISLISSEIGKIYG